MPLVANRANLIVFQQEEEPMNIGDFVKAKKNTYQGGRRCCGIIVGFDSDEDPIIRWSYDGKTWDEENFRSHIIICSSASEKGHTQCQ